MKITSNYMQILLCIFCLFPVIVFCQENNQPSGSVSDITSLPEYVYYRTNQASYNNIYYFILKDGKVYYKYNKHMTGMDDTWHILPVHKKIKNPISLSADDENLVIIDETGQIYTMLHGLSNNPGDFLWTRRWGFPFWHGIGYKITGKYLAWDISFISPFTDEYLQYPNGTRHDIGIGCTTLFLLNTDGRRITYIDPWLVNDLSNEITTPGRGEFKAINLSASGSTIFVINARGEMYTLLFDFDIAGMDTFFYNYSYHPEEWEYDKDPGKIVPRKIPRQLPIKGWIHQPFIHEKITDQITIIKKGKGAIYRTLIVEGFQGTSTGYYTKDINETSWKFVETGLPLTGTILHSTSSQSESAVPEEKSVMKIETFGFKGEIAVGNKTFQVTIPDFNPYCFYSTIRFFISGKYFVDFLLHHNGVIRLTKRERGLSTKPLPMVGAIQGKDRRISDPDFPGNHPDYLFLTQTLNDFKEVNISVTNTGFRIVGKELKGKLVAY